MQMNSFHHMRPHVRRMSFSCSALPNIFHRRVANEKCVKPRTPATAKCLPSKSIELNFFPFEIISFKSFNKKKSVKIFYHLLLVWENYWRCTLGERSKFATYYCRLVSTTNASEVCVRPWLPSNWCRFSDSYCCFWQRSNIRRLLVRRLEIYARRYSNLFKHLI